MGKGKPILYYKLFMNVKIMINSLTVYGNIKETGGDIMEVLLIVGLFVASSLSLNFLVGGKTKSAGAMNIVNLCLTVAVAYQFDQVKNIIWLFVCAAVIVVAFFVLKFYINRKRKNKNIIDAELIEEKDD